MQVSAECTWGLISAENGWTNTDAQFSGLQIAITITDRRSQLPMALPILRQLYIDNNERRQRNRE